MIQIRNALVNTTKNSSVRSPALYYNVIRYNYTKSICNTANEEGGPFSVCQKSQLLRAGSRRGHPWTFLWILCTKSGPPSIISAHQENLPSDSGQCGNASSGDMRCSLSGVPEKEGSCNVCSLWFQSYPIPIIPGNFFTADYSYIQKLAPPIRYEQQRRRLCKAVDRVYRDVDGYDFCPVGGAVTTLPNLLTKALADTPWNVGLRAILLICDHAIRCQNNRWANTDDSVLALTHLFQHCTNRKRNPNVSPQKWYNHWHSWHMSSCTHMGQSGWGQMDSVSSTFLGTTPAGFLRRHLQWPSQQKETEHN